MKNFLEKLLTFNGNKYVLAKAAMHCMDKVVNMKGYEEDPKGKEVPRVLEMILDKKLNYTVEKPFDE